MYYSVFLLACTLLIPGEVGAKSSYYCEYEAACARPETLLAQAHTIGMGPALSLLRHVQWRRFCGAQSPHKRRGWRENYSHFLLENGIADYASRSYLIEPDEMPILLKKIAECAEALFMPSPLLLIIDDELLLDVAAYGWGPEHGFLVLTTGFLRDATDEQVLGGILYGLGVLKERHHAKSIKLLVPVTLFSFCASLALIFFAYGGKELSFWRTCGTIGILALFFIKTILLAAGLARRSEKRADGYCAAVNPDAGYAFISFLERSQSEEHGGDMKTVLQIISQMEGICEHDRAQAATAASSMAQGFAVMRQLQSYADTGIFGSHRSLQARKEFFLKAIFAQMSASERKKE